jgi:hypothetical protein
MHQHKIVAQVLLILTILNSVLAAPIVRVREMPKAPGAVAVQVESQSPPNPENPETQSTTGPGSPEPQSQTSPEISETQSPTGPEISETQSPTGPENPEPQLPTSPEHSETQSMMDPVNPEPQSLTNPKPSGTKMSPWTYSGDKGYEMTLDKLSDHSSTSTEGQPPPSPERPKVLMTPAEIKATKIAAGVSLFAAAVLGAVVWSTSLTHSKSSAN